MTTPEQGRQAVREQAALKVDFIKIWVDDRNGRAPRMMPDVSHAIIDEAHAHGLKVNAHVFYLSDVQDLVAAGIDGFAHLARDKELDDATVQAIVRRGIVVMPTLATAERATHTTVPPSMAAWLDGPVREALPQATLDRVKLGFTDRDAATAAGNRERYAILQRSVAKLARAGREGGARQRHGHAGQSVRRHRSPRARDARRGRDDADAGAGRGHEHVRRLSGPEGSGHAGARASARTSSSSTPIRSTTSPTRGGLGECSWTAARSIARRSRRA